MAKRVSVEFQAWRMENSRVTAHHGRHSSQGRCQFGERHQPGLVTAEGPQRFPLLNLFRVKLLEQPTIYRHLYSWAVKFCWFTFFICISGLSSVCWFTQHAKYFCAGPKALKDTRGVILISSLKASQSSGHCAIPSVLHHISGSLQYCHVTSSSNRQLEYSHTIPMLKRIDRCSIHISSVPVC